VLKQFHGIYSFRCSFQALSLNYRIFRNSGRQIKTLFHAFSTFWHVSNPKKMTAKVIKRKFLGFQTLRWALQGFNLPAPQWVKLRFLRSNQIDDGDWIETGTYLGDTSLALSKNSPKVITLEPSQELYEFSRSRLRAKKNVNCLFGTSEEQFNNAIALVGDKANIWLDGHYSGDITHLGATETPLFFELQTIVENLPKFKSLRIFIDDIHCCPQEESQSNSYPTLVVLTSWATENGFTWYLGPDIIVMSFQGKKNS